MKIILKQNKGFTLIETIAVLVILGIVAAVTISRGMNTEIDLVAQTEAIRTHLRYAQTRAMATDVSIASAPTWGLRTNAGGTGYWLYDQNGTAVSLPGENNTAISLANIGLTALTPFNISFNDWGVPFNGTTGAALTADFTITVSDGTDTRTITITQVTGFIP